MKQFLEKISIELVSEGSPLTISSARRVSSLTPRSFLKVGKLVAFRYLGRDYIAYVIATNRTSTGLYFSSRRNLLVTCLTLDLTQVSTQLTLSTIYKKRKVRSNYKKITDKSEQLEDKVSDYFKEKAASQKYKINFTLFGKENFKTFKIKNIMDLTQVGIKFDEKGDE